MPACPMCAEDLSAQDVTCPHCGSPTGVRPPAVVAPVATAPSTVGPTCPMCTEAIASSDVVCPHCGSATGFTPVVQPAARVDDKTPDRGGPGASKRTKLIAIIAGVAILAGVAVVIAVKKGATSTTAPAPTTPASPPVAAPRTPSPVVPNPAPPPVPAATTTPPPTVPAPVRALQPGDVERLINAQAASLPSTAADFIDSFADSAIAFFPQTLTPFEGRQKIIEGSGEAWGRQGIDRVDTSPVAVGIAGSVAWATTNWKITLGDSKTVMPVRVTELLSVDSNRLSVIAASFSVASPSGSAGAAGPVPAFTLGVPATDGPESWFAKPAELAQSIGNDPGTSLIGSDAKEYAIGPDAVRKMLTSWKSVRLEIVGKVRVIDGAGNKIVVAFARWPGPKPTLFRVLGLFVVGEVMAGPPPWVLATVHYSVAVPASGAKTAAVAAGSTCTIAALSCDQFSTRGQIGKKLHALAFNAEQAGRHAEAICLARSNLTSSDKWLAGAANFDSSRAWDGLGCHDQAVAAIEASLAVRPRDQGGWKETCEQCRKMGGTCSPCDTVTAPQTPVSSSVGSSPPPAAAPTQVLLMSRDHVLFEVWENGTEVLHGGSTLEVTPGTTRTVTIKAKPPGYKVKTITIDGTTLQVDFSLDPIADCLGTLTDPKSADCRTQFCSNHKDDPGCELETP